jgi:hypothetical protein
MDVKKTITSIFIVPTLGINRDGLLTNGFINGYIKDENKEYDVDVVYILFKPKNLDKFRDFLETEYVRTKNIIEDYDYEDGFVVVVYQIPDIWKKDIILVKQGKYSKTSLAFQESFPKVIKVIKKGLHKDELSLQTRIFMKSPDLQEYWENKLGVNFNDNMEVWEGWNEDNETLNLEKLKIKI